MTQTSDKRCLTGSKVFTDDLTDEFEQWMIDCYASSLATTLYTVILRMLPDIAAGRFGCRHRQ